MQTFKKPMYLVKDLKCPGLEPYLLAGHYLEGVAVQTFGDEYLVLAGPIEVAVEYDLMGTRVLDQVDLRIKQLKARNAKWLAGELEDLIRLRERILNENQLPLL